MQDLDCMSPRVCELRSVSTLIFSNFKLTSGLFYTPLRFSFGIKVLCFSLFLYYGNRLVDFVPKKNVRHTEICKSKASLLYNLVLILTQTSKLYYILNEVEVI